MGSISEGSDFYREYFLAEARRNKVEKDPAPHQAQALHKLGEWYKTGRDESRGGILVLPTGGGKTFTAGHFICHNPLSDGFKVLWLAHTHHLLEQAFFSFGGLVGLIAEPKSRLNVRVVSGTIGHFPVHTIKVSDDVVIGSLQTVTNAVKNRHKQLDDFLNAAEGNLFVVFDEAHHSLAPSYRNLLLDMRTRFPQIHLLGLTATPTHTEEKKRGWLIKLFPQGIIYQVAPSELMAQEILARPVFEEAQTAFNPGFDEGEYEKWVGTNRDLPEDIINTLASSQERNNYIVNCYVSNCKRYGKTIIFVDRWAQCEYISVALEKRGIRANAIYSHVGANPGSAEARNRRTAAENAIVLQDFRDGKLDVLINIRMATEGTDVPNVQTVFLTRQTTSQILLTQMVGRALRGPKFGGTKEAFIVSFIDNWKQRINWAAYNQLATGPADDSMPDDRKRPPLQLISIDLVRRLARQMDSGINMNPVPYKAFLPIGWYCVEYDARAEGSDNVEAVSRLAMVYEDKVPCFEQFLVSIEAANLQAFQEESIRLDQVREKVTEWADIFFSAVETRVGGGLIEDLFSIARHVSQDENHAPKFFPFDVREQHDLDAVAQTFLADKLNRLEEDAALQGEYTRQDRYWRVIYYTYDLFKSHYDACINRIFHANRHGKDSKQYKPGFTTPEAIPYVELSEELKERVKSRDGFRCVCCGYDKQRTQLQVDHISPSYHGGNNHFDNLQTLCKLCNGPQGKGIEKISFRNNQTTLTTAPSRLPMVSTLTGIHAKEPEWWKMFLRRTINLFFRCAAVDAVEIGGKGEKFLHWRIRLFPGNNEKWLEPHLPGLIERIRQAREKAGYRAAPHEITVTS